MAYYAKQTWTDKPDGTTPIYAAQLKHIEDGIAAIDNVLTTQSVPSWALQATLAAALAQLAQPPLLTVVYSSGWTVDATMAANPGFSWLFVGGANDQPPPSTAGPQAWRAANETGIQGTIDEPLDEEADYYYTGPGVHVLLDEALFD